MKGFSIVTLSLALLLASVPAAMAQTATDGSIYSRFGIGELRSFGSSQVEALGGGGTAMSSFTYINPLNPASLADQILTRIAIGATFQTTRATDASDNTSTLSNGALGPLQFSLPIYSRRLGVGVSLEPYSRVNYHVETLGSYQSPGPVQDTTSYVTIYEGSGGLQKFSMGLGARVGGPIRLGASMDVIFGIEDEIRRTVFLEPGFTNRRLTNSTRLAGLSGTVGGLAVFSQLLGERDILTFGASASLPLTLHGRRVQTIGEEFETDTLGSSMSGEMKLPMSLRAGLTYRPDERWLVIADGVYEPWSSFSSDFTIPGYAPNGEQNFRDRMRTSAGIEFLPAGAELLEPFLKRVAYRAGVFYDQSYVNPNSNYDLNTLGATFGLSLPSFFAGTRVDLNFEVGRQGSTTDQLVQNTYYRIGAYVSIGERWFEKRRLQ